MADVCLRNLKKALKKSGVHDEESIQEILDNLGHEDIEVDKAAIEQMSSAQKVFIENKKRQVALAFRKRNNLQANMDETAKTYNGDWAKALINVVAPEGFKVSKGIGLNLERFCKNETNNLSGLFNELLGHHEPYVLKSENEDEILKAMDGQSHNDNANAFVKDLDRFGQALKERYNANGAMIGDIKEVYVKHSHNAEKMLQPYEKSFDVMKARRLEGMSVEKLKDMALDRWKNFTMHLLDGKTFNIDKSRYDAFLRGVPDEEINKKVNEFLDHAYKNIIADMHPSSKSIKPAKEGVVGEDLVAYFKLPANMADKKAAERVFIFKDNQSWGAYNRMYGAGSLHETLANMIANSGRELGAMKLMGPNPEAMLESLIKYAYEKMEPSKAYKFTGKDSILASDTFNRARLYLNYQLYGLQSTTPQLAKIGANLRGMQTVLHLGQMVISSLSDYSNLMSELVSSGQPMLKAFVNSGRAMFHRAAMSKHDQEILTQAVGIFEHQYIGDMAHRFFIGNAGDKSFTTHKLLPFFFKWTGATFWDKNIRSGTGIVFADHISSLADKSFDQLDKNLQNNLKIFDITKHEWDLLRANPMRLSELEGENSTKAWILPESALTASDKYFTAYLKLKGIKKITPMALNIERDTLSSKLRAFYAERVEMSNMQPDSVDLRYMGILGAQGPMQELMKVLWQFKSFAMAFTRKGLIRRYQRLEPPTRIKILGTLVATTMGLSALSIQTKQVLNGKKIFPLSSSTFWKKVLLQSGGLGFFGDLWSGYLFQSYGNPTIKVSGPVIDWFNETLGLIKKLQDGKDVGDTLTNYARYNLVPNIWYTNLAIQEFFLEVLSSDKQRRKFKNYLKKHEQALLF